jgi:hypothetical protein
VEPGVEPGQEERDAWAMEVYIGQEPGKSAADVEEGMLELYLDKEDVVQAS